MSILHTETFRDHAKLREAQPLIQMSRMNIVLYDRIELHDTKTKLLPHAKAVRHQFLPDVLSTESR
jgi:hypothetical protein